MWGRIAAFILLNAALWPPIGARTLTAHHSCRVVAGEKYLGSPAGESICSEIERAIASGAPGAHYTAEVTALSPTRLSASLTVNGRELPEHKFAVMDAGLSFEAVQRFARALASDVAKAAKK